MLEAITTNGIGKSEIHLCHIKGTLLILAISSIISISYICYIIA